MIFNSPVFLFLFLPLALGLYFITPARVRPIYLVVASIFFYTWGEGELVLLLLASIFVNYISGLLLDTYKNTKAADYILYAAVTANVGGLIFYKYSNFLSDNLNIVLSALNIPSIEVDTIYFPLGISFYTFQALSYLLDIYREKAPAETNPVKAALYITFFPKLISGPIIPYSDMKRQMDKPLTAETGEIYEGVKRFIFGLAKKVIIADNLAIYANSVFAESPSDISAITAWTGTMIFGLQMYFDFSGYTDMAIGAGRMFGFKLPENFNFPYVATSISDFWRRWHISLSTWFRDYFYTPLSLTLAVRWNSRFAIGFSVFIAFITIGLWHGAAWNYVIFGFIHAVFITWEMTYGIKYLNKIWKPIQHIYTIFIIIVSTIFFRAGTVSQALDYLEQMFYGGFSTHTLTLPIQPLSLSMTIAACVLALPVFHRMSKRASERSEGSGIFKPITRGFSILLYLALLYLSLLFVASAGFTPFIYFQF